MSVSANQNNFGLVRLMLAALVVLAHAPQMLDGDRHRELLESVFGTISFGELAVDGFFIVSGYLIVKSWENTPSLKAFLTKRILRIYPGFIVAVLVSLFVVGPIAGGEVSSLLGKDGLVQAGRMVLLRGPQLKGAFADLPDPQLNSPLWTIAYEFRCYLVVGCLGALGLFRWKAAYATITATTLLLLLLFPKPPIALPILLEAFTGRVADDLRFLTMFFCGGSFYVLRGHIRYERRFAAGAAVALIALMFFRRTAEPAVAVFGAYILLWFAFHVATERLSRVNNQFDISFGLYLYAWPMTNLLIMCDRNLSPWLLAIAATLISAGMGAASWILVERPSIALKPAN